MEARELVSAPHRPFEFSLRVRHPSMDPADITRELKLKPEHSFKAGEPRQSRSGIAPTAVHAETYWLGCLDPSALPGTISGNPDPTVAAQLRIDDINANVLDVSLMAATLFLRSHAGLFRKVHTDGGYAALLVSVPVSDGEVPNFTLTPTTARAMVELGIAIEFEFPTA